MNIFNHLRTYCILFFLVASVSQVFSKVFDIEVRGPEWWALDERYEKIERQEAYDKMLEGRELSEREQERAFEHIQREIS